MCIEFQVPFKGNSKSAKGPRGAHTEEQRRVQSEKMRRHWSPPPGVKVDNYSFVWCYFISIFISKLFFYFFKSCWKCSFNFHQICYNLNQDLNFYCYCMWLISWFFILSCKFYGFCFLFSFQMYHSIFWFVRVFFLFQRGFEDLRWIWIVLFLRDMNEIHFFSVVGKWRCDGNVCLLIKPFKKHNYLCQWFIFSLTKRDGYFYK